MNNLFISSNNIYKMNEQLDQRLALVAAALGIKSKEKLAEALGVSRTTLYYYEKAPDQASEQFVKSLQLLEEKAAPVFKQPVQDMLPEEPSDYRPSRLRFVSVIGWAHAGEAESYEEMPTDWRKTVATDCRDSKAFAVQLEGDSMAESYEEGDLLILQPSHEIYSGCLAVIRFRSDGVIFRRVEVREDRLILLPLNKRYDREEVPRSEIVWAYPLYGMYRQVWKR